MINKNAFVTGKDKTGKNISCGKVIDMFNNIIYVLHETKVLVCYVENLEVV